MALTRARSVITKQFHFRSIKVCVIPFAFYSVPIETSGVFGSFYSIPNKPYDSVLCSSPIIIIISDVFQVTMSQ